MKKQVMIFLQSLLKFIQPVTKDILVIFLSVLSAFSVDRLYEKYEENTKLHEALRNFYMEAKQDSKLSKDKTFKLSQESINFIKQNLGNENISLNDIERIKPLYRTSIYNVGLSYIEKNPNLTLDSELQYQISKTINTYTHWQKFSELFESFRLSPWFEEKGEKGIIAKKMAIRYLEEQEHHIQKIEEDFLDIEKLFRKKNIIP